MSKILTPGTRVRWTSMSQGHTTTKEGVIEAVIDPGDTPHDFDVIPANQLRKFGDNPRDHVSYLVRVRKCTFYWPLVKNLTVVKDDLSTADRKAIKQGLADSAAGRTSEADYRDVDYKAVMRSRSLPNPAIPPPNPATLPPAPAESVDMKAVAEVLVATVRLATPENDYYKVGTALAKALVDGGASLEELLVLADTIKSDLRKALQVVRGKG